MTEIQTDDAGGIICPTCRHAMSSEVRQPSGWVTQFAYAYACHHCGQRFGTRTRNQD